MLRKIWKYLRRRKKTDAVETPPAKGLRSESLEPRVLFSADLPWVSPDAPNADPHEQSYEQSIAPIATTAQPAAQATQADRQNLIVIDPSLLAQKQTSGGLVQEQYESAGFDVAVLQSNRDGINQLSEILSSSANVGSMDVLTTAQAEGINLGGEPVGIDDVLNSASLISEWANQFYTESTFNIQAVGLDQFVGADHMAGLLATLIGANVEFSELEGTVASAVVPPEQQARHEVVFVDTGVEGYQALVDDIRSSGDTDRTLEVILLDANRDGVEQISEILRGYENLDAVHIVSHGTDGAVQLGASTLSSATLGSYDDALAGWQAALSDEADLLIYGCDLASTEIGEDLLRRVADLTGADVAASDDLTGALELGGDWNLEFAAGEIEAELAFSATLQTNWGYVLATTPESLVNETTTGFQETNSFGGGSVAADANGDYVVVWQSDSSGTYDVYGRLYNADGTPKSGEFLINSTTADDQRSASVAMDADGDFVVAWTSNGQDQAGSYGTFAQRFNADGIPQGSEFQVNSNVSSDQWRSKVAMDDAGNFAIVFTDESVNLGDVYLQRYAADGSTLGGNTQINQTVGNSQSYADIAIDGATGNILVTWDSWAQDGDEAGVYAALLDSGGSVLASEFLVNTTIAGSQQNAKVDFANDGSFVIVWDSGPVGAEEIVARTFAADGTPTSGEISVNTYTSGSQRYSDIGVHDDGRFVVAWSGEVSGGGIGIQAQLFAADGSKVGTSFLVNETTTGFRQDPSVEFVGGSAIFSWQGEGGGDSNGVYARTVQLSNVEANNDSVSTSVDTPVVIDVLANDSDLQGDALVVLEVGAASNGTLINNGDGTVTYTPDGGYSGSDTFSYVAADSSIGLQSYWALDGDANDAIGSANGSLNGTTTVAGKFGNGLAFNESSDYVQIPDVSYAAESSISFDFKLDDNSGALFQYLYSHGDINGTNSVNVFVNEASHGTDPNVLRTVVRDGDDTLDNTALQVDIAALVGDGEWHNYTVTTGASGIEVYLDGVLVAADATRGTGTVDPAGDLYLGSRQDTGADRFYGGALDSLSIYGSALTADQVSDLQSGYAIATVDVTVEAEAPTAIQAIATTGGGLSLNQDGGDSGYLLADNGGALLGGLASLTYETRYSTLDPSSQSLVSYATVGNDNEFKLVTQSDGDLLAQIGTNSIVIADFDFRTLADGEAHTVSFNWQNSDGSWALYIDGVEEATGSGLSTGHTLDTLGALVIGNEQDAVDAAYDPNVAHQASIFDARLFSDVRTQAEVASSYRSTLPFDESNMLANWQFDDLSSGGVVTDAVSGNNLTVKHATDPGFTASEPSLTFSLSENSLTGTLVGQVSGVDAQRVALIDSLLAADSDLHYNAETDKFYKPIAGAVDKNAAMTTASTSLLNGISGALPTIGSAHENTVVEGLIAATGQTGVWLSGSDATVADEWRWADGTLFYRGASDGTNINGEFENFSASEPNGGTNGTITSLSMGSGGQWKDSSAFLINTGTVIEWDADAVLDATQALTYSITSQTVAGAFAIEASTGQITVADGSLLDYETNTEHTVTIRTIDVDGNTLDETFTVALNDLSESNSAPTDLSSGIELNAGDGNDAYFQATNGGAILGGLTEFALEFNFASDQPTEGRVHTLLSYTSASDGDELYVGYGDFGANEQFYFSVQSQQININYDAAGLFDGEQHSVAVSWDNSNGDWAFYVDGEVIDSGTGLASGAIINGTNGNLLIGQDADAGSDTYTISPTNGFAGTLYDVRIWDEVRSSGEIALNYQNKFDSGSLPGGLIANWQMDGFTGAGSNQIIDVVSGNNLTIANVGDLMSWANQVGGVSVEGNTLTYVDDGAPENWGSQINSANMSTMGFTDDYTVRFTLDNTTNFAWSVGLSATESSSSYTDIEHAIFVDYLGDNNDVDIRRNGATVGTYDINFVAGGEFGMHVNGTTLEYQYEGVTFATDTIVASTDWYVDTSFYVRTSDSIYDNQDDYSLSNFHVVDGTSNAAVGFSSSATVEDLHVNENSTDGARVGYVVPSDPDVANDVVSDGLFTEAADPGAFQSYASSSTFGNWTVESGEIELLGSVFATSPLGGRSVDLNESSPGTISQTLTLEPGKQYQVIFALTGNHTGGESTKDIRVSVDGQSAEYTHTSSPEWSTANPLWEQRSLTFTAEDTSAVLRFASLDAGVQGAIIADIQVIEIPAAVTTILNDDPTLSYDAATDKFYRFVNTPGDFNTQLVAATTATLNGVSGGLVRIDSAYENELVRQFAIDGGNDIWLGASDANNDGNWNWLDGTAESSDQFWTGGTGGSATTGFYVPTFLQSASAGEDYLRINSDGAWVDDTPGANRTYVVQWDASEVLSSFTFSLTDDAGGRFAIDSATGEVTVANGALLDYETSTSHDIDVQVVDAAGNSYVETMAIAIDNGIDPTQSVPGLQNVTEATPLTFSSGNSNAVTVTDTLAATDTLLQVSLSVSDGYLTLSQLSGITIVDGAQGSSQLTFTGIESALNAALEGMTFTPYSGFNGAVSLNMTTSLAADLIGHYQFSGDANDSSFGLTQHGTLNGEATTTNDPIRGDVLSLDGSGDFVFIEGLVGEPESITLAAWINASSVDTFGAVVISTGESPALYLEADGRLTGYYESGGTNYVITTQESLLASGWRHVAVSIDTNSQELTLYVDGAAVETIAAIAPIEYDNSPDTYIGRRGDGGTGFDFNGLIDDARIYGRGLSGSEIAALASDNTALSDTVAIDVTGVNQAPTYLSGSGVQTNFESSTSDAANDLLLQGDGRLIVVGTANDGSGSQVALTRYLEDGTLDTSFGTGGRVITAFSTSDTVNAAALQPDGSIVVVGATNDGNGMSMIARFLSDGSLDTSFDADGVVTLDIAGTSSEYLHDVVVQADGRIVAVGYANTPDQVASLVRLNTDGSLDTGLNGTGFMTFDLSATDDRANTVAVQDDGKIVIGGQAGTFSTADLAVLRLNIDGSFDTSFNGTGSFIMDVSTIASGGSYTSVDSATAILIDDSGRIVIGGSTRFADNESLAMRLNSDGTLDTSFNGVGYNVISAGFPHEGINDIALQPDGRLVLVGSSYTSSGINDVSVIRVNTDGTLDTTFDGDGMLRQPIGTATDEATAVVIDRLGNVVVVGRTDDGQVGSHIMRFDSNGNLDSQFVQSNSLDGNPTFVEDGLAVTLDADVEIFDEELSGIDDFGGSTLTLVRNGGADAEDVFSATGNLVLNAGTLELSSTNVGTYTNTGGVLMLTFAAGATNAQVNEVMQSIAYENTSDGPPANVQLDWTFSDGNATSQGAGGALTASGSTTVNITATNDAAVITNLDGDSLNYDEDDGAVVIDQGVAALVSDVDSVDFAGGNLTVSGSTAGDSTEDQLSIRNQGTGAGEIGFDGSNITYANVLIGTASGGSNGTDLVITFNASANEAAVSALAQNVTYENSNTGNPSEDDRTISFTINDGDGATSLSHDVTISVNRVNDAPVNSLPATQSVAEDGTLVFSTGNSNAISVNDIDSSTSDIRVTFTVTNGVFTLAGTAGLTSFSGDGTTTVTIEGPNSAIFAALNGSSFTPTANYNGAATLTMATDDLGNTGSGGAKTDTDVMNITVTSVNDLPTTTNASVSGSEDAVLSITLNGSDLDGTVDSFEISSLPANGTLYLDAALTDPIIAFNTYAASSEQLTVYFEPDENWNGVTTFNFSAVDNQGNWDTTPATATLTVTPVNDAAELDLDADNSAAPGSDFIATWTQGSGPVAIADTDAIISDIDSATLTSLTATITNPLNSAFESLVADTTGTSITASYDSGTSVLTLSGADSAANYQQVLRTITYDNSLTNPVETDRSITFQTFDGSAWSTTATTTLSIVNPADAGVTITAGTTTGIDEQTTVSELSVYGDGTYLSEAVALAADGSAVVVWTSNAAQDGDSGTVMGRLIDAQGNPVGNEFVINSTGTGWQSDAGVAMDESGNFVVTWTSWDQDGDSGGIYAQRFDNTGAALGTEFRVSTTTAGSQDYGSITMADNGDFVIAWSGAGVGDTSGVFAQRYDASGVALGGELLINETTINDQDHVSIASDQNGNFAVTWTSSGQDGSGNGVYTRLFDATGEAITSEQLVNTSTSGDQWISSVAMNASGEFVVTWREDGLVDGIYMQLYAADGTASGGEVQVHSTNEGGWNYPQAAIDDAGNVTVVWQDFVDSNDYGIVARQFDANGAPLGAQFVVNTHEQWYQEYPAIAMNGDGQFAIVFTDYDANNDGETTVEMRRFGAATTEDGGTATFGFVLDTQPTDDVTITLSMPDGTEGTLSTTTLTFTNANWNVAQVVTVTGVDDNLADGHVTHQLITSNASSTDANYNGLDVRDVDVTNLDNDPSLDLDANDSSGATGSNFSATWTEGGGSVAIVDVDAVLGDADSDTLTALTVTITNQLDGTAELLAADTTGTSIGASYDAGTGVLTLTGSDTVANYQQVLRSITYNNTSEGADTTTRVISFQANDGANLSTVAQTALSMTVTNDAPTLINNALTISEGGSVLLSATELSALDADNLNSGLTFTASSVVGGQFEAVANAGVAITSFTQQQVTDSEIRFVHDGGEGAPAYNISVDDGALSTTPATASITFSNLNDAPTGAVTIDNLSPSQGDTLTASNTLADADGLSGSISYQWYRDGVVISGATGSTYTTVQADVGGAITAVASYTDDKGTAESVTSGATAAVVNVNDAVAGQPVVTGTQTEDETLTADTSGISDEDGLGVFSFQWYRDGVAVSGASADSYVLDDADVDSVITVAVSYVDGYGAAESAASNATAAITNVNDAPTGAVTIDNLNPAQGDTLTASNTLVDADGLSGPISYQWYRDGVVIGGATGATYTAVQADVGGLITATASYTDDQGTAESVTSAATAAVTNVNDAVVGQPVILGTTTEDETLTIDTSGISDADGLGSFSYQWYRDGVAISGETADSLVLGDADVDANITVEVAYTDGQGTPESTLSAAVGPITNINDAPAGAVTIDNLSPSEGDTLTASNTLSDSDGLSGPISYQWYRDGVAIAGATNITYVTVQADVDSAITTLASYTDDQGTAESVLSTATAAVANVNDAVAGQPLITGTQTEDQTLTADTSGISDEDGLGVFSFQWYRDGVAVSGATAGTYVLNDADVDSTLTVAVSYVDGYGNTESTTSNATGAITNINDAPTGSVTIDNLNPAQGDTLTASNTLADADGLSGPISYQWYRDGVAISGATGATYVTTQPDVGGVITALASYTDDQGTAETVLSAATATVINVNDAVAGQPVVLGTATEDQTLTIDTSGISDADGLGSFNYQWYRDGVAVSGASAASYVLDDADVGANISVAVSYADGYGAAESTTSNAVGLVANVNDAPVVAAGLTLSVPENAPIGTLIGQVLASDIDMLTTLGDWTITSGNTGGAFTIDSASGEIRVANSSALDFEAMPTFVLGVTVSDGIETSAVVNVSINLTDLNEAPVLVGDQLVTTEDSGFIINSVQLLANDSDPESLPLTLVSITQPNNGIVIDQLDGTWRYQPNTDFHGVENISYTVSDGVNQSTAALQIVVTSVNDTPQVLTPNLITMQEDVSSVAEIAVLDVDGDLMTFTLTGGADASAFEIDSGTGALSFSQAPDYELPIDADQDNVYDLAVTVSDGNGGETVHALQVALENVNETPLLTTASMNVDLTEGSLWVGRLNAIDPDTGDTLVFEITGGDPDQLFQVDANNGEISLSGVDTPIGRYQLDVQVTDAAGLSSNAVIELSVSKSISGQVPVVIDTTTPAEEAQTDDQVTPEVIAQDATSNDSQSPQETSEATKGLGEAVAPTLEEALQTSSNDVDSVQLASDGLNFTPVALPSLDTSNPTRPSVQLGQHTGLSLQLLLAESDDRGYAAVGALVEQFANISLPVSVELAEALDQLAKAALADEEEIDLQVSGAVAGTMSLSAGFVIWMLRGGSLMASLLSSKPMWTEFDPLPVFSDETADSEGDADHPFQK